VKRPLGLVLLSLIVYGASVPVATRLLPSTGGAGGFTSRLAPPDQGVALPGTFTKYASNPVLVRGASGAWDDGEIDGESVFWDGRLSKFVMVYSANDGTGGATPYFKTGLAYSTDLITWTKEAANPVYDPGYGQVAQTIIVRGSTDYIMYTQLWPGTSVVYAATSSDLLTWTDRGVVLPLRPGEWDETYTFDPNVRMKDDGRTIQLFYAGQDSFGSRGIGYAYSVDGVTMTDRTFVAYWDMGTEIAESWGTPSVVAYNDSRWGMFTDSSAVSGHRFIDRLYTTNNGSSVTRQNQVLLPTAASWDSGQVFDSAAIWWNDTLYLFYAGTTVTGISSGLASDIGLATMVWPR
jgi:hypothetical protein